MGFLSGLGLWPGVRQDSRSARGGFILPHVAVWNEDAWTGGRDNPGPHLDSHIYRTLRPHDIQPSEELQWSPSPSAVRVRDGRGSLGASLACLRVCSSQTCVGSSPRHTQPKTLLEPSRSYWALFASFPSALKAHLPTVTLQVRRDTCLAGSCWHVKGRRCPDGV